MPTIRRWSRRASLDRGLCHGRPRSSTSLAPATTAAAGRRSSRCPRWNPAGLLPTEHDLPGRDHRALRGQSDLPGHLYLTYEDRDGAQFDLELTEEARRFTLASSELRAGVDQILKYVTWALVPTAALLFISQLRHDNGPRSGLSGAVAGTVAMVPEGLVLLTSVAFAVGVVRLGRRAEND